MLHLQEQFWCAKNVFETIFRNLKKGQVAPGHKRIWSPVWMILHWPWSGVNGLAAWRYYTLCSRICQCWTAALTWRQHRELKGKWLWGPGNQGLAVKECHWPQIDLATSKFVTLASRFWKFKKLWQPLNHIQTTSASLCLLTYRIRPGHHDIYCHSLFALLYKPQQCCVLILFSILVRIANNICYLLPTSYVCLCQQNALEIQWGKQMLRAHSSSMGLIHCHCWPDFCRCGFNSFAPSKLP